MVTRQMTSEDWVHTLVRAILLPRLAEGNIHTKPEDVTQAKGMIKAHVFQTPRAFQPEQVMHLLNAAWASKEADVFRVLFHHYQHLLTEEDIAYWFRWYLRAYKDNEEGWPNGFIRFGLKTFILHQQHLSQENLHEALGDFLDRKDADFIRLLVENHPARLDPDRLVKQGLIPDVSNAQAIAEDEKLRFWYVFNLGIRFSNTDIASTFQALVDRGYYVEAEKVFYPNSQHLSADEIKYLFDKTISAVGRCATLDGIAVLHNLIKNYRKHWDSTLATTLMSKVAKHLAEENNIYVKQFIAVLFSYFPKNQKDLILPLCAELQSAVRWNVLQIDLVCDIVLKRLSLYGMRSQINPIVSMLTDYIGRRLDDIAKTGSLSHEDIKKILTCLPRKLKARILNSNAYGKATLFFKTLEIDSTALLELFCSLGMDPTIENNMVVLSDGKVPEQRRPYSLLSYAVEQRNYAHVDIILNHLTKSHFKQPEVVSTLEAHLKPMRMHAEIGLETLKTILQDYDKYRNVGIHYLIHIILHTLFNYDVYGSKTIRKLNALVKNTEKIRHKNDVDKQEDVLIPIGSVMGIFEECKSGYFFQKVHGVREVPTAKKMTAARSATDIISIKLAAAFKTNVASAFFQSGDNRSQESGSFSSCNSSVIEGEGDRDSSVNHARGDIIIVHTADDGQFLKKSPSA